MHNYEELPFIIFCLWVTSLTILIKTLLGELPMFTSKYMFTFSHGIFLTRLHFSSIDHWPYFIPFFSAVFLIHANHVLFCGVIEPVWCFCVPFWNQEGVSFIWICVTGVSPDYLSYSQREEQKHNNSTDCKLPLLKGHNSVRYFFVWGHTSHAYFKQLTFGQESQFLTFSLFLIVGVKWWVAKYNW